MDKKNNLKEENQLKRMKIELETGAKFFNPEGTEMPPEIESMFLDNIVAFEKASREAETKTINEIIGFPNLIPESQLSDPEIDGALSDIIKLMNVHQINLEVINERPAREIYNFIETQFLSYETEILEIKGMTKHFIYEEFMEDDLDDEE